jgi:hypothetical protein
MGNEKQIKIADAEYFKTLRPSSIDFADSDGAIVGTLTLSDPMTFTGNVEGSAKLFFEYICNNFKINDTK